MFNLFTILVILFVAFGLSCLIYSFLGMFTHNNKKRLIITILLAILGVSIFFYVENNKRIVYMKEDVMYVQPIAKIKK